MAGILPAETLCNFYKHKKRSILLFKINWLNPSQLVYMPINDTLWMSIRCWWDNEYSNFVWKNHHNHNTADIQRDTTRLLTSFLNACRELEENLYKKTLNIPLETSTRNRYVTLQASFCGEPIFISAVKLSERMIRDISSRVEERSRRREHGRSADRVLSQDKREDLAAAQTEEMDMRKESGFGK